MTYDLVQIQVKQRLANVMGLSQRLLQFKSITY